MIKYKLWYDNLCSSRRYLNREKSSGDYYEKHHIIPRSLGGSDEEENLVLLTAREHFIAHLLLTKFTEGKDRSKMVYALWRMVNSQQGKIYKINSRLYETIKIELSKVVSKQMKGRVVSAETRAKISMSNSGKNNHMYGKKHSKETVAKMSASSSGERNGFFDKNHTSEQKNKWASDRKAEGNAKFKGYYITPFGKLTVSRDISSYTNLMTHKLVQEYCQNNLKIITSAALRASPYLKSLGNSVIGKTREDLGFSFEAVS